jgi:hypothetical protein
LSLFLNLESDPEIELHPDIDPHYYADPPSWTCSS